MQLNDDEMKALVKAVTDPTFSDLFGAESWALTEAEEKTLWAVVQRFKETPPEYPVLVEEFEKAVREHEFMGAQPPEQHTPIRARYALAKQELMNRLFELSGKK